MSRRDRKASYERFVAWAAREPQTLFKDIYGGAARTSVRVRTGRQVPDDGIPCFCSVCGSDLRAGSWVEGSVVNGERFYQHPACVIGGCP